MQTLNYDVVVVGAGSAGVASALASSRTGSKTLLVERKACFGGEATNSWVSAYCGFYTKGEVPTQCVKGIGDEVLTRLKEYGEDVNYVVNPSTKNASVRFHPEVVKLVLDDMMMESSVDCRLCTSLIDAEVVDNKIVSITIMDDEDKYKVYAKSFIDTTGDANLIHLTNIETMWGNEEFGIQQSSLSCLIEGVPKEEFEEVQNFCMEVGLPVTLEEIGVTAAEQVETIAKNACVPGETIHNLAGDVQPVELYDAILQADAMGKLALGK